MAAASFFGGETFAFLSELEVNNTRDWFHANKARYTAEVRAPFAALLEALSAELADTAVPFRGGENTMFRVNRDVRFSNNKAPYSTHVSGVLTRSGAKGDSNGLLYLHLEVDGGFVAAGLFQPPTPRLANLRSAMIEQPARFARVLDALAAAGLALDDTDATKTMPRGFSEFADHPNASFLKLKNLIVRFELSPDEWMAADLLPRVRRVFKASAELLDFIAAH